MDEAPGKLPVLMLAVLIVSALLVSGCTGNQPAGQAAANSSQQGAASANPGPGSGAYGPGYGNHSGYGNLTAAQRQQMYQAMIQQATAACQGMQVGTACVIQTQRGALPGTCQEQNSTFMCVSQQMGHYAGNYSGGYAGAGAAANGS